MNRQSTLFSLLLILSLLIPTSVFAAEPSVHIVPGIPFVLTNIPRALQVGDVIELDYLKGYQFSSGHVRVNNIKIPSSNTSRHVDTVTLTENHINYSVNSLIISLDYSYADIYGVKLNGKYLYPDKIPPSIPTGLNLIPQVDAVELQWNAVNDGDLKGYFVYMNGVLQNTVPITSTSYIISPVDSKFSYSFQVSSVDIAGNESIKSVAVSGSSVGPPVPPTLTYEGLRSDRVRLIWDNVGNSYAVYQDGVLLKNTGYTYYDATLLEPLKTYTFKVVSTDRYGRKLDSNVLTITTKPPEMKKPVVMIKDVTHDAFKVVWNPVEYAERYIVLVNGAAVTTTTAYEFSVTGLQPSTIYSVTVRAESEGIESVETTVSTTTLVKPKPQILSAMVRNMPGNITSRELTYTANDLVTGVRVFVDGQLIGTYPVTDKKIELDMSDISALTTRVKVEPVDADGVPYELVTPVRSTGIDAVDEWISDFLTAFIVSKNSFVYLVLVSIPLFLFVALFFWLRFKYQGMFGKTANQKGEMKDSKGSAIRQANNDKFNPASSPMMERLRRSMKIKGFGGKKKTVRLGGRSREGGMSFSPTQFDSMFAMNKTGTNNYRLKMTKVKGKTGKSFTQLLSNSPFRSNKTSSGGSRASPKPIVQSFKGKTFNLGERGDYKPFRNQGRKFR